MRKKYRFLTICFLLPFLFITTCKNYSVKLIGNKTYIHLFDAFYYNINPKEMTSFYASKVENFSWVKFYYTIKDFGHLKVYITSELIPEHLQRTIHSNVKEELQNFMNFSLKHDSTDSTADILELNKNHFYYITHFDSFKDLNPADGGWVNGHNWKTKGAGSELMIGFIDEDSAINYQIIIEYIPELTNKDEAYQRYIDEEERIIEIINRLIF